MESLSFLFFAIDLKEVAFIYLMSLKLPYRLTGSLLFSK
jgi:hypothetical protein